MKFILWRALFIAAASLQAADCFSPFSFNVPQRYGRGTPNNHQWSWKPGSEILSSGAHQAFVKYPRANQKLLQSATAEIPSAASNSTSSSENQSSASVSSTSGTKTESKPPKKYDMPWGEFQEWAIKDHLSKYTVQVHIEEDGRDTLHVYTLWRTLANEITSLSGYPLKFLVERYQEMRNEIDIQTSTEILPYLDGYAFESDGGVSGRVYGIAGVAEGTRIQTTPVAGVEKTLQKGYILTEEGIVYELGLPASETSALDGRMKMAERAASSIKSAASEVELSDVVENSELVKLGALTAVVLSGAWAMETLSHHLTVNVFWV